MPVAAMAFASERMSPSVSIPHVGPGALGGDFWMRILKLKIDLALNAVVTLKRHIMFHLGLFLGLVIVLVVGGTVMFYEMFDFLLSQDIVGPPLVDRLVSVILLVFFGMLIFSNLIITLSTTYISREVDFYISQPTPFTDIFLFKLFETILYSSWAFFILSFPLFLGYGLARDVEPLFYLGVLLMMGPFLLIPAAGGAIVTMIFAACIPARRSRTYIVGVVILGIISTILLARLSGFGQLVRSSDFGDFKQVLHLLELGSLQITPNTWMAQGTFAAARGDWVGMFYWFAVLLSTGLFMLQVCVWFIKPLYYRGWTLARGASGRGQVNPKTNLFNYTDHLYAWLGRPVKALIGKDLRVFWRDPSQWSQLLILMGLLFIYVGNIRQAGNNNDVNLFKANWQLFISFLNMGGSCFILSILSTRFFYPMLSLEGRQYWVIGLAPLKRSTLLWQKYGFCLVAALAVTVPLMIFSNIMLKVPPLLFHRSIHTLVFLSFGLTSLAVGLGAMTPNFREDNPARIANGLGGTINIVLSLIYITLILSLVSIYTWFGLRVEDALRLDAEGMLARGGKSMLSEDMRALISIVKRWEIPFWATFYGVNATAAVLPMWLGIRRWNRTEF